MPGRAWGLLNVPQNNMALLQWALGMTSLAVWKHAAFLTETHCHQQPFPGNYISPFIFSSPFRTPRMLGQRSAVAIMGISTIRVCFVLSMSQCYAPPPAFLPLFLCRRCTRTITELFNWQPTRGSSASTWNYGIHEKHRTHQALSPTLPALQLGHGSCP